MISRIIFTSPKISKILTTWTPLNASRHVHRHSQQTTLYQRLSAHFRSMPPKRASSSSKRKAESPENEKSDSDTPKPSTKKAKKSTKEPVSNGQPNNTVLPVTISFPNKIEGTTRISSWNVSGLQAAMKKGFDSYAKAEDADILLLTETKVNENPSKFLTTLYPYQYWSTCPTKGYAGTAILCKHKPLSVKHDFPTHPEGEAAAKGRLIALEYSTVWIVGTYVPNAGQNLKNMHYKVAWNDAFASYLYTLNSQKPVIWMGDINCAPTSQDLSNSKSNWNKTPGHTQKEVDGFNKILELSSSAPDSAKTEGNGKLVDVWRQTHPDLNHYTYFSYRFRCREKRIGWRLDMFLVNEKLLSRVKLCEIRSEIYGASDHCPIVLEIEGEL